MIGVIRTGRASADPGQPEAVGFTRAADTPTVLGRDAAPPPEGMSRFPDVAHFKMGELPLVDASSEDRRWIVRTPLGSERCVRVSRRLSGGAGRLIEPQRRHRLGAGSGPSSNRLPTRTAPCPPPSEPGAPII
jgi:hypothetical protein